MPLAPGTQLGPYEVVSPLGAGGMGEVYRARDTRLDRDVAVKVLPARLAENAEAFGRFEREAKAVAALSHPNILAIHDFGRHEGTAYAAMELVEGETLRKRLEAGPLPTRKAVEYAAQVARGLAAAHEKGIVHRDLKPENVIVTPDGRVKILDFGLARQAAPLPSGDETSSPTLAHPTDAGTVMGTVGYMAPEQVRGETADHRSDIFSVGCVLYEMLTGRRAFQQSTGAETMTAILQQDPLDSSPATAALPLALERTLRHCLEKSPAERFQSARDLAFDLEAAVDGTGRSAAQPTVRAASPSPQASAWRLPLSPVHPAEPPRRISLLPLVHRRARRLPRTRLRGLDGRGHPRPGGGLGLLTADTPSRAPGALGLESRSSETVPPEQGTSRRRASASPESGP